MINGANDASDVNKSPDLGHYRSLEEVILGEYQFDENQIKLFNDNPLMSARMPYTLFHELAHKRLVASTCFGDIQGILGSLHGSSVISTSQPGKEGIPWSKDIQALLQKTISASWFTHEGYAEYYASRFTREMAEDVPSPHRPLDYEEALSYFTTIEKSIPSELQPFANDIMLAFALVIMNTSILKECPISNLGDSLERHLADPRNYPDYRLRKYTGWMEGNLFSDGFVESIRQGILSILALHELEVSDGRLETARAVLNDLSLKNAGISYEILDLFSENVEKYIVKFEDVKFLTRKDAREERSVYKKQVREYLSRYGVNFRVSVQARDVPMEKLLLEDDTVEITRSNLFTEVLLPAMSTAPHLDTLLKSDFLFIAEWGLLEKGSSFPPGIVSEEVHFLYNVSLLPLGKIMDKSHLDSSGHPPPSSAVPVAPTLEKYTFWGTYEFARSVWDKFVDRIAFCSLEPTAFDLTTLQVHAPIQNILAGSEKHGIFPFPFTQGKQIYPLLKHLNDFGVLMAYPISHDSLVEGFLFVLKTGPQVLIRLKSYLSGVMEQVDPALYQWIKSLVPPIEEVRNGHLSIPIWQIQNAINLAKIDELGGLRNSVNTPQYKFT